MLVCLHGCMLAGVLAYLRANFLACLRVAHVSVVACYRAGVLGFKRACMQACLHARDLAGFRSRVLA